MELKDILIDLKRPFPEAQFRIGSKTKTGGAMILGYIDARDVSDRLNAVCPDQWSNSFQEVTDGILCTVILRTDEYSLHRSDVGSFDNVNTDKEGEKIHGNKAVYSDAFKRAAVHFGVNRCMYDLPQIWAKADDLKDGKYLTKEYEEELITRYQKWLDSYAVPKYGEPYDIT